MTPQSTTAPRIPRFQLPSDEENAESYLIFQTYYSNFPFLEEAPDVYKERWGCVGRMDFFGVFNYNTQYTLEEGRQAFIRYFQQTKWEYTEDKFTTSDDRWTRTIFYASKEGEQKPYLANVVVQIYIFPAKPTEAAGSVSDGVFKEKTEVHISLVHIESADSWQYSEGLSAAFVETCHGEWWLTWH